MERSFIVTENSKYFKDDNTYSEMKKIQKAFIKEFFNKKEIEAKGYILHGNGIVNYPFEEYDKKEIQLYIKATENDLNKYNKMLCKKDDDGFCAFRKNSNIGKEFAQECIDRKIVINVSEPDLRDYFKSLDWRGYSYQQFIYKDKMYVKIESECLKENDTPEGFIEIKLSEYYKVLEDLEKEQVKE